MKPRSSFVHVDDATTDTKHLPPHERKRARVKKEERVDYVREADGTLRRVMKAVTPPYKKLTEEEKAKRSKEYRKALMEELKVRLDAANEADRAKRAARRARRAEPA